MHFRNSWTRSTSGLAHAPGTVGRVGGRGLKGLIRCFTAKFQETSVTRSLTGGKLRIGSMVTGLLRSSSFSRVMHMSLGRPFTSAEQEPHLPALQFQRTARSFACSAWIW